ncbi:MAG TPA: STAS domain-containing protein [Leptospiraceae bacterium]|nr:STAS domain-containing protein [Leptospiraceae bacterium]HMW05816.1 STAS domain-containing protein [Leptospiraceae bacterium]HMX34086.1 STAS domain-containing protein [Leptospiraceae bacterium]HMY33902.1 STAS domain-containing protein [Leptospiraceae bacterium]HMZ65862.1 STAS domain-containing protein [Leptospiraceae bacterium]
MNPDLNNSDSDYGVEVSTYKNYVLISFINYHKLDLYNSRDLAEVFKVQNENGSEDIVIDMSPIQYIDSSGLGTLATQGMLLSKKNKRLNLLNITHGVSHLFKASGFDRMFKLFTNKEQLP